MTDPTTLRDRVIREITVAPGWNKEDATALVDELLLAAQGAAHEERGLDAEQVMEWLHDLDGTQHYITHETSYDGDDMEGVECITGVEGHREDAQQLIARLATPEAAPKEGTP